MFDEFTLLAEKRKSEFVKFMLRLAGVTYGLCGVFAQLSDNELLNQTLGGTNLTGGGIKAALCSFLFSAFTEQSIKVLSVCLRKQC